MKRKRKRKAKCRKSPERPILAEQPYTLDEGETQSLIGDWVDCRKRARLALDGWRRAGLKDSLEYGSLFHNLLEKLYGLVRGEKVAVKAEAVGTGSAWLDGALKDWRALLTPRADAMATQQTENCIAQALGVWDGYLHAHPEDLKPGRWIELEGKFDVQWADYRLRGRRDGLLQIKRQLWLLETKTKSQITANLDKTLAFDFQNLFYITANMVDVGRDIVGVKYNVIRRPQHKMKDTETPPQYSARIAADVAKRPEHWFVRYEISYPAPTIAAFQDELRQKLDDFAAWLRGDLPTYRNQAACVKRWNCAYIDLCAGDESPYARDGKLFEELIT